jgi:hypothetical protein
MIWIEWRMYFEAEEFQKFLCFVKGGSPLKTPAYNHFRGFQGDSPPDDLDIL